MPRRQRIVQDGGIYHVLNRRTGKLPLFETDADYLAFEKVIDATHQFVPMRVLAYCLMPNHWHLMLWPARGKDLSRFHAASDGDPHAALAWFSWDGGDRAGVSGAF